MARGRLDLPLSISRAGSTSASVRILIVKLSALGDVIHTLPALTTLRRHAPTAVIRWLVEDAAADLLENHPALDQRLVLPRRELRRLRQEKRWFEMARTLLRFRRELRAESYEWVIDFQGLAKSAVWVAAARSPRKAGFDRGLPRNEGAWLTLHQRVMPPAADVHALERNLILLEGLGFPRLPIRYDLPITPELESRARTLLEETGVAPGQTWIAVNPVTRWPTKDWHPEGFAQVIRGLDKSGIVAVFTGGPGDKPAIDAVERSLGRPVPRLDGRTRILELAALFRIAPLVLTTDTGPMHLAAAVGARVVALFGPTAPWRTGPYGPGHEVLREELSCSPCFRRTCLTASYERRACMLRILPERVVTAVLRNLGRA